MSYRPLRLALPALLTLFACTDRSLPAVGEGAPDPAGTSTSSTSTSGSPDPTATSDDWGDEADGADDDGVTSSSTTSSSGSAPSDEGGDDCSGFLGCLDTPRQEWCDFWAQDCPSGEKCVMAATTPGSGAWDAFLCVPVADNPAGVGEPCERGPVAHTDTCDATSFCYYYDEATGLGTCVEHCVGDPGYRTCRQSRLACHKSGSDMILLCLNECSPLLSGECPTGQVCTPSYVGTELRGFICYPPGTAVPGAGGDECDCAGCCARGHLCVTSEDYGTGCAFDQCCTEYCDIDDSTFSCAEPDQTCVALFAPDTPDIGNVGACLALGGMP